MPRAFSLFIKCSKTPAVEWYYTNHHHHRSSSVRRYSI